MVSGAPWSSTGRNNQNDLSPEHNTYKTQSPRPIVCLCLSLNFWVHNSKRAGRRISCYEITFRKPNRQGKELALQLNRFLHYCLLCKYMFGCLEPTNSKTPKRNIYMFIHACVSVQIAKRCFCRHDSHSPHNSPTTYI